MHIEDGFEHSISQPSSGRSIGARLWPAPKPFQSIACLLLGLCAVASSRAQISPAPASFTGMMVSNGGSSTSPYAGDFPGVGSNAGLPFGVYRIWDTDATPSGYTSGYALEWPAMQTSTQAGTTTLSTEGEDALALELKNLYAANPNAIAWYTLSRTPYWTFGLGNSCTPYQHDGGCDKRCNYYNASSWDGTGGSKEIYAPGQCDISPDLTTANGSGVYTDQNWINWVTGLANYLNTLTTSDDYAQVGYFEIWNEFDRSNSLTGQSATSNLSYEGNYRELLRMAEDARCIILGATAQPTIHNYTTSGGTEACNTTNFSGGVGLMANNTPVPKIVTPSSHAQGTTLQIEQGTELMQNFLYCNVPSTDPYPPTSDCNWSETLDWGGKAVDVINFHMKPGNEAPPNSATNIQPEAEMSKEYTNATSVLLTSHETDMPFWNGEGGYSGSGWNGSGCTGCIDLATLSSGSPAPGEEAAFVARYALIQWSLGFSGFNWYQYDGSTSTSSILSTGTPGSLTLTDPGQAYYDVANWIEGSSIVSGDNCGLVSGSSTGTLWACEFTKSSPSGWTGRAYWDVGSAYQCLGSDPNPCSGYTYSLTVPSTYNYYQTAIGTTQIAISSHKINVSSMPTLVETATFTEGAQ
jgi:hypothetical protein